MCLEALFLRCLHQRYHHVENGGDYATERLGETLYVYLEGSDGLVDWKNNLNFPAKPYRRMGKSLWWAHRGFLTVWKSVEPYLAGEIMDPSVQRIVITGYSHGAALAVLCHEYVYFHRPDLRDSLEGYGFGCPRVLWGYLSGEVRRRWQNFTVIRNLEDLVTHLPPWILGYTHVGSLLELGERGKYSPIDAHRAENILTELRAYERKAGFAMAYL